MEEKTYICSYIVLTVDQKYYQKLDFEEKIKRINNIFTSIGIMLDDQKVRITPLPTMHFCDNSGYVEEMPVFTYFCPIECPIDQDTFNAMISGLPIKITSQELADGINASIKLNRHLQDLTEIFGLCLSKLEFPNETIPSDFKFWNAYSDNCRVVCAKSDFQNRSHLENIIHHIKDMQKTRVSSGEVIDNDSSVVTKIRP